MNPTNANCRHCGRLEGHDWKCPDIDFQSAVRFMRLFQFSLKSSSNRAAKSERNALLWHGKYMIVKHENNKLRQALYRQKKKSESSV